MNKSFAVALLMPAIAFARGDNDGSTEANAVSTVLMDNDNATLTLHSYNSLSTEGVDEFHGDLTWTSKVASFTDTAFGYCIQMSDAAWDCYQARIDLNTAVTADDFSFSQNLQVLDQNAAAVGGDAPVNDAGWNQEDAGVNWINTRAKAYKTCGEQGGNAAAPTVACEAVNSHFYRNFNTSEVDQDYQFSRDQAGQMMKVRGFYAAKAAVLPTWTLTWADADVEIALVSQQYVTNNTETVEEEVVEEPEVVEPVEEEPVVEEEEPAEEEPAEEEPAEEEDSTWWPTVPAGCTIDQDTTKVACTAEAVLADGCSLDADGHLMCVPVGCEEEEPVVEEAAPAEGEAEAEAAEGEEAAPTEGEAAAEEAAPAEGEAEAAPAEEAAPDAVNRLLQDAVAEEAAPAETEAAPAEGEAAPAEGEAAPAEGEAAPAEGEAAPAEGEAAPAEETVAEEEVVEEVEEAEEEVCEQSTNQPEYCEVAEDGYVMCPSHECAPNDEGVFECEEGSIVDTEDDANEDGATAVTTYAAAMLATVCALVF